MGILFCKKTYYAASAAAFTACVMMIINPDILMLSAKKGISLWLSSVLPSMLPFFICVNFMTGIGIMNLLPVNLFPFMMSSISGYPVGAKVVGDLQRNGITDVIETKRLMSFCSTSGPVFMIGAVGVGMLGSQTAGFVIAAAHYCGAVMNGIIYSLFLKRGSRVNTSSEIPENTDIMEVLTGSIFSAFRSMAVILAYIIFFMFIMDIINLTGIFGLTGSEYITSMMKGFVEMTVGCSSLAGAGISLRQSAAAAAAIISWGGLSIIGQSMSMLTGTGISFGYMMLTKLTHSFFAGITALFLGALML